MTDAPNHDSLATALVAFQAELPKVGKNHTARIPGKNGGEGYSYTYADLADLSDAAHPVLAKHGLAFTCSPRLNQAGSYELAGILTHTSGETMEGSLPLIGRTPQELGSSMTYMRRYLLGAMTGIVTDDDDDGSRAQAAQPTQAQEPIHVQALRATLSHLDAAQTDALRKWWGEMGFPGIADLSPDQSFQVEMMARGGTLWAPKVGQGGAPDPT